MRRSVVLAAVTVAVMSAWLMSPSAPRSTLPAQELSLADWLSAHPGVGQRTLLAEWILVRFEDLPHQEARRMLQTGSLR